MLSDLRFALRQLAKSPGFTIGAVVTLALGIGGGTTMYGFMRAVERVSQPTLPEPECVARVYTTTIRGGDERGQVSLDDYRRWKASVRSFEILAAYQNRTQLLRMPGGDDEASVLAVTPSYLALLKTPPTIGRAFTEEELAASDGRVALLSERAWHSRFASDGTVVGRRIVLDAESYTVIGVMSERLGLAMSSLDVFVPLTAASGTVMVIGRRRASASWAQASAELAAVGAAEGQTQLFVRVLPILDDAGHRTRALGALAVGPALLVLLIGCGNVASLVLVRTVRREHEIAVRLALGVSRARLAAQLLTEGWTLAAAAGALGILLAGMGLAGIRALLPASLDVRVGLDLWTLLFATAATLATPLVFSAAPLLHSLRTSLADAMRASLHKPLLGVGRYHLRDLFAVLEVGLSVALVVLALMYLSAFRAVHTMDLTFDATGLLVARIRAPASERDTSFEGAAETRRLLRERLAALPGITAVTMSELPFGGDGVRVGRAPGRPELVARDILVDADYFETLHLPVVRGRGLAAGDRGGAEPVAVVNESTARRLWPSGDPLGEVLYVTRDSKTTAVTIVGVSKDAVRLGRATELGGHILEFRYSLYRPWPPEVPAGFDFIARVRGEPGALFGLLRETVSATDTRLHLRRVSALAADLDPMHGETPLPVYLLGAFGVLALTLTAFGVFGVMSQLVDERQRELGVRVALGATSDRVMRLVVGDGLMRVGIGAGVGLLGLFVCVRAGFAGLLTATAPDPWLWLGVVAVLVFAAVAACYIPARRAARVDPMVVLRCE